MIKSDKKVTNIFLTKSDIISKKKLLCKINLFVFNKNYKYLMNLSF